MNAAPMSMFVELLWRWTRKLFDGVALMLTGALVATLAASYFAVHKPHLPWLRALLPVVGRLVGSYKITSLDLHVRVDPSGGKLVGQAELRLQPVEAALPITLLLDPGLRVQRVTAAGGDEGEQPLRFLQLGPFLTVAPPAPTEQPVAIRIAYRGRPLSPTLGAGAKLSPGEILLPPDALWYPSDAQSFFSYSVRAEVPAELELVNAAPSVNHWQRGRVREWEWRSERPVAGFALVAGTYQVVARRGTPMLQAYVRPGDGAIAQLVLDQVEGAHGALRAFLGGNGLPGISVFVHPSLTRAFYDGSGVIGLPRAALVASDQGFGLLAHEVAHAWWGGTVSGGWLSTGRGSQWITEGLAEVSSILATARVAGRDGQTARLFGEFFDPARQQVVADMTVLDNAIEAAEARETIYRKGSYVAWMLRSLLGEAAFAEALRALCERYAFQNISDREVQEVFEEVGGQKLDWFFSAFVRGNEQLDFHVDAAPGGKLKVALARAVPFSGKVQLWVRQGAGQPWQEREVELPYEFDGLPGATEVWVDPQLAWPDMQRENNRFPRQADPLYVTPAGEQTLVVLGDPFPWSRATAQLRKPEGAVLRAWQFDRGFLDTPRFDAEHGWFVGSLSEATPGPPAIVLLETDGGRRTPGRGHFPTLGPDGAVYATVGERIVRIGPSGRIRTVVRHPGQRVHQLRLQPETNRLAYVTQTENRTTVFTLGSDDSEPEPVFLWERAPVKVEWIGTEDALAVAAVDATSWHLWEVGAGEGAAVPIAQDVFALADLTISPDGQKLALAALAQPAFPRGARSLFVLDRVGRQARSFALPQTDFVRVAWETDSSLIAIAQSVPSEEPLAYPLRRSLYRIPLPDGPPEPIR